MLEDQARLHKIIIPFAFNVGIQLNDIKANVRVESLVIKPSQACKSNAENISVFTRLLECLHLANNHDLVLVSEDGELSDECPWSNFTYNWTAAKKNLAKAANVKVLKSDDTKLEATSYLAFMLYRVHL